MKLLAADPSWRNNNNIGEDSEAALTGLKVTGDTWRPQGCRFKSPKKQLPGRQTAERISYTQGKVEMCFKGTVCKLINYIHDIIHPTTSVCVCVCVCLAALWRALVSEQRDVESSPKCHHVTLSTPPHTHTHTHTHTHVRDVSHSKYNINT